MKRARILFGLIAMVGSLSLRCGSDAITDDSSDAGDSGAGNGGKGGGSGSGGRSGGAGKGSAGTSDAGAGQSGGSIGDAGSSGSSQANGGEGGDDDPLPIICTPGETQACLGSAACQGAQACRDDGRGWGACDCGSGGAGGRGGSGGSGGSSGSSGRGGSAGSDGGSAGVPRPMCDPLSQTGCEAGEKCTAFGNDDQQVVVDCAPDGTVGLGEACNFTNALDDCTAGMFCVGPPGSEDLSLRVCQPLCDLVGPNECATGCYPFDGLFDGTDAGICLPTCDLLTQDCPSGQACTFAGVDYPLCVGLVEEPGGVGEACAAANECGAGTGCLLENTATTNACGFYCDATTSSGPNCTDSGGPGSAYACITLYALFADTLPGPAGVCVTCDAVSEFTECPLLLPGGCDAESDCDVLLDWLLQEYTCDSTLGACVLAD